MADHTIGILQNFQLVNLNDLQETAGNPQQHDIDKIKESIRRFGLVDPFIINDQDGILRIVGGHGRKKALLELIAEGCDLPDNQVSAIIGNYTEEQAQLLLLALNRIQGQADPDLLADFIINFDPEDLGIAGFDPDEIELLSEISGSTVEDILTDPSESPDVFDLPKDLSFQFQEDDYYTVTEALNSVKELQGLENDNQALLYLCREYLNDL